MNLEDLVCGNLAQNLKRAARPTNFDAVDLRDFARAKMNGLRTGRRIADARCYVIGLIAQIRKKAVGLLVVGRLEKVNQIIYVGISREQILPAVVIEVE